MKHLKSWKVFENTYSSLDEYQSEILGFLKKYNLFPEQIRYLLDQYSDDIEEWYNEGKYSKDFAEKIAKDLNLSTGGLMQYKMSGGNQWQNIYYK
jgi:hypothetical protein